MQAETDLLDLIAITRALSASAIATLQAVAASAPSCGLHQDAAGLREIDEALAERAAVGRATDNLQPAQSAAGEVRPATPAAHSGHLAAAAATLGGIADQLDELHSHMWALQPRRWYSLELLSNARVGLTTSANYVQSLSREYAEIAARRAAEEVTS